MSLLKEALEEHLAAVSTPPGDVEQARREGARRRRTRRGLVTVGVVGAGSGLVAAVVLGAGLVGGPVTGPEESSTMADYPSLGRLDLSDGLRAYADPGRKIFLGGREFDAADLEFLDTDAAATPAGVVFYDKGRPMLLGRSGEVTPLVDGTVEASGDFHPTAKIDSAAPHVAWATLRDGVATITVHDLATRTDVDSLEVECGDCSNLVIDALDDGTLLFRTGEGTQVWEVGRSFPASFAGPKTRVVDVRNGTLLHSGPAPTSTVSSRYLTIPAPVDAQLTFDGRHVLNWSSRLQNTRTTDPPVRLEEGPVRGLGFWTVDTDGSVLVAALDGKYPNYRVHDCEIPSGECTELGPLKPRGGDPAFIGNDM